MSHVRQMTVPDEHLDAFLDYARSVGAAPGEPFRSEDALAVHVHYLDSRTVRRLELFLARGATPEPTDPADPFLLALRDGIAGSWLFAALGAMQIDELETLAGDDAGNPNVDDENARAARMLVELQTRAENAADNATRRGDALRELARTPVLAFLVDDALLDGFGIDLTAPAYSTTIEPTGTTWADGLLTRAAWCDVVAAAAGRVSAACDSAISDLPDTVRPRRDAATLLDRIDKLAGSPGTLVRLADPGALAGWRVAQPSTPLDV